MAVERRLVGIEAPLRVAVVGYGYWGPNLARNALERPELELAALCERDPARGAAFTARVPGVPVTPNLDQVLDDPDIDAVIVATPPRTHHPIVRAALEAGKHVLVEKPLATNGEDARDLISVAAANDVVLMPGHTFVYSPPVDHVRRLIADKTIGDVYFVTSSRMNLGKYQPDGVICDLAPHDLSILLYWLDEPLVEVAASARDVLEPGVATTAFLTLTFVSGTTANVQISWLAPRKVREMIVVGSRRMVQYDDTAADETVRVYDRGMDLSEEPGNFGEQQLTYRSGDMIAPRLEAAEPLGLELADFARAIKTGARPRSHAQLGLEIVLAIEAAEESLRRRGQPVAVAHVPERVAA
jgi:predicted dehydrogenase